MGDLDVLPEWPPGTVAVLSTGAGAPHAIPVSTARRAGDRAVVLALSVRRESLARLREDPRVALTLLAPGDVAVTAHGRAAVAGAISERVTAVRVEVERIQDHGAPDFVIEGGAPWRWTTEEAAARDADVHAALSALAK